MVTEFVYMSNVIFINIFAFCYSTVCNVDCLVEDVYQNSKLTVFYLHIVIINFMCQFISDLMYRTVVHTLVHYTMNTPVYTDVPVRYLPSNNVGGPHLVVG